MKDTLEKLIEDYCKPELEIDATTVAMYCSLPQIYRTKAYPLFEDVEKMVFVVVAYK